jgi:hypothetical protein
VDDARRRPGRHRAPRHAARARRAALLLAGVVAPSAWLLTTPADAAARQTATVQDAAEAWYAAAPVDVCSSPLGCPPAQVPTSPYPAGTLHVGVAAGQETARSYLQPDLSTLPAGATPVGGTMTLPVDTSPTDGTVTPSAVELLACLVTAPFTDATAGSTEAPPATDCSTSSAPVYHASSATITVDLTPFARAWADGAPQFGVALLPSPSNVQPTDVWHLTINGRSRSGPHVSSQVTYTVTPLDLGSTPVPPASGPAPGAVTVPPIPPLPAPVTGVPPGSAPVVAPSQPPVTIAARPVVFSRGFQYPLAFLLPLALLAGAVFFARLFTRDALPVGARP